AIFDNHACAIVHPSTAATVLVALGANVTLSDPGGVTRRVLLEDFFVGPDQDMQRENDLRPHEILIAIHLPPASPGVGRAYLKQGQKESFDWPLADVAVVLERDQGGVCKRARVVLGAAAVPGRPRRSRPDRLAGGRDSGEGGRARRDPGRDPAEPQRLQAAVVRNPGAPSRAAGGGCRLKAPAVR